MRLHVLPVLALSMAALPLSAQDNAVGGPLVGYVAESGAVRPILGVPGASLIGDPVQIGFDASLLAVSPGQDSLLAVDTSDGSLALVNLVEGTPVRRAISAVARGASRIVFSPGGGAAALFYPAAASIQILKGLPANPEVAATLDLSGLPGPAGAFAVSSDAGAVVIAAAGSLFSLTAGGDLLALPFAGQASLIRFLNGSRDVLVAGADDNQVALVRDVTGQPTYRLLASSADGISRPVGLAASADDRRAVVANAGSNAIALVELAGGIAAMLPCGCQVTTVERLKATSVYRISDLAGAPLWILDAGGTEPQLLFVPALVPQEVAQ